MKMITFMKHNTRRIIAVLIVVLLTAIVYLSGIHASADDLADQTARNLLFEKILNEGGTIEEARAAAAALYREQHGLRPLSDTGSTNPSDEMETVPHKPTVETEKHEHNYVPTVSKEATCSEKGGRTDSCTCGTEIHQRRNK